MLLPAQEQIDGYMISAFAVGELRELAQYPFREPQIEAKAAAHDDVLLEADG
ncbi:MAG: hypothetical protein ACREQN_17730 [Candidatus Binataceae bacterium]